VTFARARLGFTDSEVWMCTLRSLIAMIKSYNDIAISDMTKRRYIDSGGDPRALTFRKERERKVFVHPDAF